MSEMSDYFSIAERNGAVLLDASNFQIRDFRLMSFLRKALLRVASGEVGLGYDSPVGSSELRTLIATHESKLENVVLSRDNVVVNSGGVSVSFDNLFRFLSKRANNGKSEVILSTPTYPEVIRSIEYNQLTPVCVSTSFENRFQPTARQINSRVSEKTAAIFLISPGNPYCSYIDFEDLKNIADTSERFGCYLVLDAIFEEALRNPRSQGFFSLGYKRTIKLKGPSKDRPQMNDFRIGWSISRDPETLEALSLASEVAGFSISTTVDEIVREEINLRSARLALSSSLTSPTVNTSEFSVYNAELASFFSKLEAGLSVAKEICTSHPAVDKFCMPEAGNVIFIKLKDSLCYAKGVYTSKDFFYHCLRRLNVGVTPGHLFLVEPRDIWFRATLSRDPAQFVDYLGGVLDLLK